MTYHLLLDFDRAVDVPGATWDHTPDNARAHGIIVKRLARAGYRVTAWSFERSTNGWHARAALDPAPESPMEIVALQAICGSDPLREACNVQRARTVQDFPAYQARRLRQEIEGRQWLDPVQLIAAHEIVLVLRECERGPDAFWLDRWNTLYAPNPQRRKEHGASE